VPTLAPSPTAVPALAPSPTAVPTLAAAGVPVRLVIAAIGLDRQLVSVGLDRQRVPIVPNHDIGWYNLSARPGQGENIVLWGHVLRFKSAPQIPAPFARIKELALGAELTLYSDDGSARRYQVVQQVWVTPDQVQYILPQGRELLTLVSCIGDKVVQDNSVEMTNRLITIAAPAP
jgi:sortase (surface protein transpeptidase)